jgi:hypothetical protein
LQAFDSEAPSDKVGVLTLRVREDAGRQPLIVAISVSLNGCGAVHSLPR